MFFIIVSLEGSKKMFRLFGCVQKRNRFNENVVVIYLLGVGYFRVLLNHIKWYLNLLMWWKKIQTERFFFQTEERRKLNKNIVRFLRRDWWAVLLCIGSHSKLWLNCVIIVSLKFGSAVAAAFLHFTNSYTYANSHMQRWWSARRQFTYAATARYVCMYSCNSRKYKYTQFIRTCVRMYGHRWLSVYAGAAVCVASIRTHLLFTHCYAFGRTHAAQCTT